MLRYRFWVFVLILGSWFLAACGKATLPQASPAAITVDASTREVISPVPASLTPTQTQILPAPTSTEAVFERSLTTDTPVSLGFTVTITPTQPYLIVHNWQTMPVIPQVGQRAAEIYLTGLKAGNNPQAFSKIGDGEISAEWFLRAFDYGPDFYNLGSYHDLSPVIAHFTGSFQRDSMAARRGFNTTLILSPDAADPQYCHSGESPLTCELRLHRPSLAILSLGTNQVWSPFLFEQEMRQILDILIQSGVLPVLSTKADNLEGDYRINEIIASLSVEYELPLWNFWLAVQPLPDHGLQPDMEHLTYGGNDFSDPIMLQRAWTVRNLTALQVLDALWRDLDPPTP